MRALILTGLAMAMGAGAAEAQSYGYGNGGYHSSYSEWRHVEMRGDDRWRGYATGYAYPSYGRRDDGPPPPAEVTWGTPAWGQPYAAGSPYGHATPHGPHGYGRYGDWHGDWRHDRGGRYGWSHSGAREPRPAPGYRETWGYNNDQHATGYRFRYGDVRQYSYGEDRRCDCAGPYLYDR